MPVLFVIDTFDVDKHDAVVAEVQPYAIEQLRQRISQHLKSNNEAVLRVRFNRKALFKKFSYFEGLDGVLPTQQLIPRSLYRDYVNEILPEWLSDNFIMRLGLLEKQIAFNPSLTVIDKIIFSCDSALLSDDFYLLTQAFKKVPLEFWQLFKIADVQARFIEHLMSACDFSEELAVLFVEYLLKFNFADEFFNLLAYEQHQELLRQAFSQLQLELALPPRSLPRLLLTTPLLELSEQAAKDLPSKCLKALGEVSRLVEKGMLDALVLAPLMVASWPTILEQLNKLVNQNVSFVSKELIYQLEGFNNKDASQLAIDFKERVELSKYMPLSNDAVVKDVLTWSKGYFEFIQQQFSSDQKVDESLNLSFSNWLLKQSARVARSDSDWRQFSNRVNSYLEQNYLVVICMVDALSALHQDLILDSATKVDHLSVASEILFAPLPTLTEIGKMSVITGKEASQLPSDQEAAIRQSYQAYLPEEESLKLVKSWKSASEHINEKTNLLVFLENRIDERLHECVSFDKHRSDVAVVLRQMMNSIDNWKKDAGYMSRDIVFLVTADHGMTVTQSDYKGPVLGEAKERVFKVKKSIAVDYEDFALIDSGGKSVYLAAKSRVRLNRDALLAHGGLTPEEVLIPFVTLSSRQPELSKTPLEITLVNKKAQRLKERCWQINIELHASVLVENICIKFASPLVGAEAVVALAEKGSQRLLLTFSSENEQSGVIEFSLSVSYDRAGAHEVNNKFFSCVLPEPLIDKDETTQGFEDMFS